MVVLTARETQNNTYYDVEFGVETVSVTHEVCVFSACLHRHHMPIVQFSGRLGIQCFSTMPFNKGNGEFKYVFKDTLSQWTITLLTNGRVVTQRSYPSGPRDNNDYLEETTTFVPDCVLSACVASMPPFEEAMLLRA